MPDISSTPGTQVFQAMADELKKATSLLNDILIWQVFSVPPEKSLGNTAAEK